MPPRLALFICIAFIITILILDKKYKVNTSWALWIPLLWLLIRGSRAIILWLNPGIISSLPEDASEGSPIDRNFLIILFISGTYILLKRRLNWSLLFKDNFFVFFFFLYCGMSIIWSDVTTASFNAWIKMMILLVMALIIITDNNPIEAIRTVIKRTYFVLIPLSIILIKYFPEYGRSYSRWTGITFHSGVTVDKNGLGMLCMVSGLFLVWDSIKMLREKVSNPSKIPLLINIVLIGMVIWLWTLANSMTAVVGFIAGVCILVSLEIPFIKSQVRYLNVIVFALLFIALLIFISFNALESLVYSLGRDMTLTGRTNIWARVLSVDINPIIGTGYSSFWHGERGASLVDINFQRLTQAHNGFIEAYLNLGWIGLSILILLIINTYIKAKNALLMNFQYGKFLITYFVVILLGNITEATLGVTSTFWFMFVLISLQYNKSNDQIGPSDAAIRSSSHQ